MRLIDADALKEKMCEGCDNKHLCKVSPACETVEQIDAIPTIEAEPIVRCKDCKHFGEADSKQPKYHECKYFSNWATVHYMLDNDYCSCSKRKDDAKE